MTLGRNAVAYLTESLHGAGSPQAQRVQIRRGVDMEKKKEFAKKIIWCDRKEEVMKSIVCTELGNPELLEIMDVQIPVPSKMKF